MEVQILKENLVKAVQTALKFTSNKTQMPVLAGVMIEADEKGIYLFATNLESGLRLRVAGKIIEPGIVVVPARVLADLAQYLPVGRVNLIMVEGGLRVEAGKVKAKLQVSRAEDFPPFWGWGGKTGVMDVKKTAEVLSKVGYVVSNDEARPVLTGFLWRASEKRVVATDGYRLSLVEGVEAWELGGKLEQLLVPSKAFVQAMQVFDDFGIDSCDFEYDEKKQQLSFLKEDVTLSVRLLGGDYPQYESILPKEIGVEVRVNREEFLESVRSVAIFARDSANIVKLTIEGGKVVVSANAPQVGENVVEVEAEVKRAGKMSIAFNSKYLIDFMTHSGADRVGMGLSDPLRPGLFYEVGNDKYQHVIMPVRVRQAEEATV